MPGDVLGDLDISGIWQFREWRTGGLEMSVWRCLSGDGDVCLSVCLSGDVCLGAGRNLRKILRKDSRQISKPTFEESQIVYRLQIRKSKLEPISQDLHIYRFVK